MMVETLEAAAMLDDRAVAAKQSDLDMEGLIEEFRPFIHSRVSKYSLRSDTGRRDELFSVALLAFYESIRRYDIEKGHFFPFADRVVRRRIIDQLRKIYSKEEQTIPLDGCFDDQSSAQTAAVDEISVRAFNEERRREMLVEEIEQFKSELSSWGITMESLASNSPKHQQLRKEYTQAVTKVQQSPDIVQTIRLKHYFPVKAVSEITGLPQKKLERARTFIIASIIIATGDYDLLSDYVNDRRDY
ncbi:MAG: hypothetical protein FWG53_03965 [Clostridiales bacterium]|nr:hypothetical protein [Clostridiales bacterium]